MRKTETQQNKCSRRASDLSPSSPIIRKAHLLRARRQRDLLAIQSPPCSTRTRTEPRIPTTSVDHIVRVIIVSRYGKVFLSPTKEFGFADGVESGVARAAETTYDGSESRREEATKERWWVED